MYKRNLREDVDSFLDLYFSFRLVESPKNGYLAIGGVIPVLDDKNKFWGGFDVLILVNESDYPYTVPIVIEQSMIIDRNWDFHISKNGECCLDIPHKLQRLKNRGIVLREFYQEVIYPFFANYHFKNSTGSYANGEYRHHFEGIAQFYKEEYELEEFDHIIKLLETAVHNIKYEPNNTCPLCGGPKYKKCCRKIVYKFKSNGLQQLKLDLLLFRKHSKNLLV